MGGCCSNEKARPDSSDAAKKLAEEIADPKNTKAPSFEWTHRGGFDHAKMKLKGSRTLRGGLVARAGLRAPAITLELQNLHIGDEGAPEIGEGLRASGLSVCSLNLSGNGLTRAGATAIAQGLTSELGLRRLIMTRNDIDCMGLAEVGEFVSKRSDMLELLELPLGAPVEAEGPVLESFPAITSICQAMHEKKIQKLTLKMWGKGCHPDAAASLFSAAGASGSVTEFHLIAPRESIGAMSDPIDGRSISRGLTKIELRNIKVESSAMDALLEEIGDPRSTVVDLCLYNCGLNEASGAQLSHMLKGNRSLTTLDIGGNGEITPNGYRRAFAGLSSNKKLRTLNITGVVFPDEVARSLLHVIAKPSAAPITVLRTAAIANGDLATKLTDVQARNELRPEDETSSASSIDDVLDPTPYSPHMSQVMKKKESSSSKPDPELDSSRLQDAQSVSSVCSDRDIELVV